MNHGLLSGVALLAWAAAGGIGWAQGEAPPARLEVSLAAGLFSPADRAVGDLYRGSRVAWSVDGDLRVAGPLSLFAGLRWLSLDGRAIGLDAASGLSGETQLSARTLSVGARFHRRWRRAGVFAGVGVARTGFTETWREIDAGFSGSAWGPAVHGGVAIHPWRRLGVVVRADWVRAQTGQGSLIDADVGLGGVDVAGGVGVRF